MKVDGGATIQTYTGGQIHLTEPRADEIHIADIAHSLSMQCRFTGHTAWHYSVAQHCILVSDIVAPQFQLEALLHDATEAYLCDLSRPLKHFTELGEHYLKIEARLDRVIRHAFVLPLTMSPEVKKADNTLLYVEKSALLPTMEWTHDWGERDRFDIAIERWTPAEAEVNYLARFERLWDERIVRTA